ncbi:PREDICTED: probable C-mannosyltransferase DPY19L1 [Papilio xuthus]|uniref:Probable C-mannosyltransferase DPY19L1 n=1 Tax=Papilio xuthus TaxID=66420 RepID=A0AAJ7EES9_PAPXU|nr:PREDICTED: probable C-mannosyltransferase DPY19L1 [Papilio xuthus]
MAENANTGAKVWKFDWRSIAKYSLLGFIALFLGFIHYKYVSNLFENDRNFSYLSDLEREMSLRTEMGFYYSYYKTIVEEIPYIAGISKIMYDKLVEYPKEVNAFNRFNIFPEVIIGTIYRYFEPALNSSHRECHMVERDSGMEPVESCVGLGVPIIFYLEVVWWMAGLTVSVLFLHAATLSGNLLGGLLAIVQYFANHTECTRVQWAPNERENFALPILLLQGWLLTIQLRDKPRKHGIRLQVAIFLCNCLCLLFWQFSQFIFFAQLCIYFLMEQFYIIDTKVLSIFLHAHFCGLHIGLLQGNDMLKSSLYTSSFVVLFLYSVFFSSMRIKIKNTKDMILEFFLIIFRFICIGISTVYLKIFISKFLGVEEDSHIWDMLFSKFSSKYKNFHTLIYTCTDVFDFLPFSSIEKMFNTFLIPFIIVNILNILKKTYDDAIILRDNEIYKKEKKEDLNKDKKETDDSYNAESKTEVLNVLMFIKFDPALFYNLSLMMIYWVFAIFVMRLKLLLATQMCLLSSLIATKKLYRFPKRIMDRLPVIWFMLLLPLGRQLVDNVTRETAHIGEFSDYPQEEMLKWISSDAGTGAFAGSMPILATVMLATRKPIVAHPHYENLGARKRAYSVYKVYGRFSSEELYEELRNLRASYLIVESKYCYGRSNKGCSFADIWDIEEPALARLPQLCNLLLTENVDHFYPVFRNQQYAVFLVHDYSVRYMPRTFST